MDSLSLVFDGREFEGLELPGMFPEDGLFTGEVKEPPTDARFGVEVEFLPSFTSFLCLTVSACGGTGGGGAREDLLLLLLLVVVLVLLVSLVLLSDTSFKLSSSSCKSLSLFFTITLRLMVLLLSYKTGALCLNLLCSSAVNNCA